MSFRRRRLQWFSSAVVVGVALSFVGVELTPSHSAGTGVLSGTVATVLEAGFEGVVGVSARRSDPQPDGSALVVDSDETTVDATTGRYELVLPESDQSYRLQFWYDGDGNYLSDWVRDESGLPVEITMSTAATLTLDFRLKAGGTVTGRILGEGQVWPEASIKIFNQPSAWTGLSHPDSPRIVLDASTGEFSITRIRSGSYSFYPCISHAWVCPEIPVTGTSAGTVDMGTVDLEQSRTISGTAVVNRDGSPLGKVYLNLRMVDGSWTPYSARSTSDGSFTIAHVAPGEYVLCHEGSAGQRPVVPACWGDDTKPGGTIIVVDDEDVAGITVRVADPPVIRGTLVAEVDGVLVPYSDASVSIIPVEGASNASSSGSGSGSAVGVDSDGSFEAKGWLLPGSYILRFHPRSFSSPFASHFYENAPYMGAAVPLDVRGDDVIDLGKVELSPRKLEVSRIAGDNRFETAVKISRTMFPDPVATTPVVYLTNGYKFADSLAAGPAASVEHGALLTVQQETLPSSVADELRRLNPNEVVIVGDETSVGASVAEAVGDIVGQNRVTRLGGSNRYETARMVVRRAFPSASHVYLVTGRNFPDALSAGAVAAQLGQPVILVDGLAGAPDPATVELIGDLKPTRMTFVGSVASVTDASVDHIGDATDIAGNRIDRVSGANRYETAMALQYHLRYLDGGLVAVGTNFADALAAVPLAAQWKVPLYLTPSTCLLDGIVYQSRRSMNVMVVLGGEGTLSKAVEKRVSCGY